MRKLLTLIMLGLCIPALAVAAEVTLQWDGHENATAYRIYQSVDGGTTWAQAGADIAQPDPFPGDAQVSVTIQDVPEDTLVIFRASAMRGLEEAIMTYKGAWYDHRLMPPGVAALAIK